MKRFLLLPALLAMFRLQAQQIEEYRYWINDDPAGVTVSGIGPNVQVNLLSNLVLPTLTKDYNTITIQFKDTNDVYSVPVSRIFTRNTGAVTGYEYWIDDDIANRVAGTITAGTSVNLTSNIPLCLTPGTHVFAIRFQGASGTWSVPITRQFTSTASPDTDGDGLCDALDPCPLLANVVPGQSCNDNDACTTNDVVDANCNCAGTFADADNDGTCDASDLCPGGPEPGTTCDDGNASTSGDVIGPNCLCAGALIDCLGVPGGTAVPGTPCNDNDDCTTNDIYQLDCGCAGTFQDNDGDGTCDADDVCPGSPEPGSPCNDNDPCTTGDAVDTNCNCAGTVADADNDGTCDANDLCPGGPEPGTPCDDSNANTTNDVIGSNCLCAGMPVGGNCTLNELTVTIQGDSSSDVDWAIYEQGTNNLVEAGGQVYPNGSFSQTLCIADGCYYLVVTDGEGDGITGGGYLLRVMNGPRIIDNSGNFTSGGTSAIANNGGFCLPLGNDRLISASNDRMDLRRGASGNCSDKLTADNTPNNTSGNVYQFWFYDPNGGLSIYYPANGATSNQVNMFNLPALVEGQLYNVRVRTRISPGVWREWGGASRVMINNTLGQCPATKLQDEVGNTHLSCGKVMTLGSGAQNLVYAKPKTRFNANCVSVAANKYQFRFRLPSENKVIVKYGVGANPWTYLNNANMVPGGFDHVLELCKPYEVEVRASFDGGGTWCAGGSNPYTDLSPWGDVCALYTTLVGCGEVDGGGENMALESDELAPSFKMYPNPNRGDQLYLNLQRIEEGVNTVSVDIYDTFGKRVSARTIAVADGFINTVLELNGELAAGMYMVNITAGEAQYMERLVIQP